MEMPPPPSNDDRPGTEDMENPLPSPMLERVEVARLPVCPSPERRLKFTCNLVDFARRLPRPFGFCSPIAMIATGVFPA